MSCASSAVTGIQTSEIMLLLSTKETQFFCFEYVRSDYYFKFICCWDNLKYVSNTTGLLPFVRMYAYACTYICILCGCTIRLWCADSLIKSVWKYTLYSYDLAFTVVLLTKPLGKQVNRICLIPKSHFYDWFRSSDIYILQDVKPVGWNSRVTVTTKVRPRATGQRQRSL